MMGFQSDFLCYIQVCSQTFYKFPPNCETLFCWMRQNFAPVSVSLITSLSRTWREVVGSSLPVKCCLYLLGSVLVFQNGSICD